MSEMLDLSDLTPLEFEFVWPPHTENKYVLVEASESVARGFRSKQLRNAKLVDGKLQADMDGMYESQALLVSGCLFRVTDKGRQAVGLNVVNGLPAKLIKRLFEKVKEMSSLEEKPETAEALEKKIAADQERLTKLRNGNGQAEEPEGNAIGESISSLPTS